MLNRGRVQYEPTRTAHSIGELRQRKKHGKFSSCKSAYNPFWGGFVIESPRTGTFKRFSETKVLVLSVSVTEEQHAELKEMLDVMWKRRRKYGYNYIGLATKRPATF